MAIDRESAIGCTVLDRATLQVEDVLSVGDALPGSRALAKKYKYRAALCVPLLRSDEAIGAIAVMREAPGAFAAKDVALFETFANQAVIAIENARLFNETKEALERQTATAEILKVISESPTDVQPVFNAIVESCRRLFGGMHVALNIAQGEVFDRVAYSMSPELRDATAGLFPMPLLDDSVAARAMLRGELVHVEDLDAADWIGEGSRSMFQRGDHHSALSAPLMREGKAIGAINVFRDTTGRFKEEQVALLRTFADQAVIAIENVRLFHALQEKNAQIEAVSRHKSEFLANMSHELRTPLNAILGFSEVLGDRYFGELNEKQDEYVRDIRGSGEHLLSLINDILDLSKVEAGKMELELSEFDLPAALKNVVRLVKERAQRHGIAVSVNLAPGLGAVRADERKLKQIMLNLLSNAVKFTPDGGAITVRASPVGTMVEIAVADTGAGIAPQDLPTVFEEFKQVGSDSARKAEGTGLGLPLAKKFVELHGGEIRVESDPGAGSTFTIVLPSG